MVVHNKLSLLELILSMKKRTYVLLTCSIILLVIIVGFLVTRPMMAENFTAYMDMRCVKEVLILHPLNKGDPIAITEEESAALLQDIAALEINENTPPLQVYRYGPTHTTTFKIVFRDNSILLVTPYGHGQATFSYDQDEDGLDEEDSRHSYEFFLCCDACYDTANEISNKVDAALKKYYQFWDGQIHA